jgi:hypothetical protein
VVDEARRRYRATTHSKAMTSSPGRDRARAHALPRPGGGAPRGLRRLHVIVNTPTGSGKSLIALGAHVAALASGQRSFYTAPIKALVSEKFFALCGDLGAENVGMLTGDASINASAPVICATAEIVANMALARAPTHASTRS